MNLVRTSYGVRWDVVRISYVARKGFFLDVRIPPLWQAWSTLTALDLDSDGSYICLWHPTQSVKLTDKTFQIPHARTLTLIVVITTLADRT